MTMNYNRRGTGKSPLLIHRLWGNWHSWRPVLDGLAEKREVIAVDSPSSGDTRPLSCEVSIETLAEETTSFLQTNGLIGVDIVGSSMGARSCCNR